MLREPPAIQEENVNRLLKYWDGKSIIKQILKVKLQSTVPIDTTKYEQNVNLYNHQNNPRLLSPFLFPTLFFVFLLQSVQLIVENTNHVSHQVSLIALKKSFHCSLFTIAAD